MVLTIAVVLSFGTGAFAQSSNVGNSNKLSDILGHELVKPDQDKIDDTKLQKDIASIVGKVRIVGFGIAFVMLILAGISFSTSGKNEQRRTGAFLSLIGVAAGIFIMMQASTIAGYFANLGG